MESLQSLLTNDIQIACTDLQKLLNLYRNGSLFDKNMAALLISSTLSNTTLPLPVREKNIRIILGNWNRICVINDPLLSEVINKNLHTIFTSVLAEEKVPRSVLLDHAHLITNSINNTEFLIVPIITDFALEQLKKHGRMPAGILELIIRSPQSVGGKIIHTILSNVKNNTNEPFVVPSSVPLITKHKTRKTKGSDSNESKSDSDNDSVSSAESECADGSECGKARRHKCQSGSESDSDIDEDEDTDTDTGVCSSVSSADDVSHNDDEVRIDVNIKNENVNIIDKFDQIIKTDIVPQGAPELIRDDRENDIKIESEEGDDEEIDKTYHHNTNLVTRITKNINPEVVIEVKKSSNDHKSEPVHISNTQMIETLFDDICTRIMMCHMLMYRRNKEIPMVFTNEYDEIISPFVNSDILSPKRLLAVFSDIYKSGFTLAQQFIDCINKNCDENIMKSIASHVPEMYKSLFGKTDNPRDHLRQISNRASRGIIKHYSHDTDIGVFAAMMSHLANYMDNETINNIIIVVNGIEELETKPTYQSSIMSLNPKYRRFNKDRSNNNNNNKSKVIKISEHLLNIDAIEIVNSYFPVQLMNAIQSTLFENALCVFSTRKHNYDRYIKKALINYTQILNSRGYLPYDNITKNDLQLTNQDNRCPMCLHDTKWVLKKCKHSICRRCFISNAYTKNNMQRYKGIVFEECITCNTINTGRKGGKRDAPERRIEHVIDSEESD